jgi:hypothetical protein
MSGYPLHMSMTKRKMFWGQYLVYKLKLKPIGYDCRYQESQGGRMQPSLIRPVIPSLPSPSFDLEDVKLQLNACKFAELEQHEITPLLQKITDRCVYLLAQVPEHPFTARVKSLAAELDADDFLRTGLLVPNESHSTVKLRKYWRHRFLLGFVAIGAVKALKPTVRKPSQAYLVTCKLLKLNPLSRTLRKAKEMLNGGHDSPQQRSGRARKPSPTQIARVLKDWDSSYSDKKFLKLHECVELLRDSDDLYLTCRLQGRDLIDGHGKTIKTLAPKRAQLLQVLWENRGRPVLHAELRSRGLSHPAQLLNHLRDDLKDAKIQSNIVNAEEIMMLLRRDEGQPVSNPQQQQQPHPTDRRKARPIASRT